MYTGEVYTGPLTIGWGETVILSVESLLLELCPLLEVLKSRDLEPLPEDPPLDPDPFAVTKSTTASRTTTDWNFITLYGNGERQI